MQSITEVGDVNLHMLTTVLSIDICGSYSQSLSQNFKSISASGTSSSGCSLTAGAEVLLLQKLRALQTSDLSWKRIEGQLGEWWNASYGLVFVLFFLEAGERRTRPRPYWPQTFKCFTYNAIRNLNLKWEGNHDIITVSFFQQFVAIGKS